MSNDLINLFRKTKGQRGHRQHDPRLGQEVEVSYADVKVQWGHLYKEG